MEVDLTNCDREPIHLLGNVQPFGFLVGVSRQWMIEHISQNAAEYLPGEARAHLGCPLTSIFAEDAIHTIRGRMQTLRGPDAVERIFSLDLLGTGRLFDIAVHVSAQATIIECEPSQVESAVQSIPAVRSMLTRLQDTKAFDRFCNDAARMVRALIEFDRVMVYRFAPDGAGEVIAESARHDLVKYMGLHYPASDIPKQARELYQRNWLRIIPDIQATPSPILSVPSFGTTPLDLSMSMLRSVSPIHIEYLGNMGVGASLSISILQHGRLWGLFACHHYAPRHITYERRSAAELFGQMFALLLESREREVLSDYEATARQKQSEVVSRMAKASSAFHELSDHLQDLGSTIDSDGIALYLDGVLTQRGTTPTREETLGLMRHLDRTLTDNKITPTDEIGREYPPARDFAQRAGGMLVIPISAGNADYLVFFRTEQIQTVNWAGDPTKPATLGPNGVRLTPRKSFEAWQETVRGRSRPWSDIDMRLAETLRITLLEVVLRLTDLASKERKAAQQRQELLIAELNHRVRNILALIRGLIMQSKERAMSIEDFASVVGGRVQALARAHDQITVDNWGPAPLRALFAAEASAYLSQKADRIVMTGPEILLEPQAFSTLALVAHELLTNSAKYGALCDSGGKVRVTWDLDASGKLVIDWSEEGGPPVRVPSRRGFGSTIIERSIPFDLKGEADIDYQFDGLKARFSIPAAYVHLDTRHVKARIDAPAAAAPSTAPTATLGDVLIVEDNMIIALDAEAILAKLGAKVVETASTVSQAISVITQHPLAFALLDVNLGHESSFPIADVLLERKIPFVFATGYGTNIDFPERFQNVPVVSKPYAADTLLPKIQEALAKRS